MRPTHILIPAGLLALAPSLPAIDGDGDGMCDVWEARFHATALHPDDDEDGDGASNAEEATAGTDPFDPSSRFHALLGDGGTGGLRTATVPGKNYRGFVAPSPAGPWTPLDEPILADGGELLMDAPREGERRFFRVLVTDADSDGDGVSDWAESQLHGFDPEEGDSFGTGSPGHDLQIATAMLQSLAGGGLTASIDAPDAFEKEGLPAIMTYTRSGDPTHPFTLFIKTTSSGDPTKSAPEPGEFQLRTAEGQPVGHRLVIPAGQASAALHLHPVPDGKAETPEHLRAFVGGGPIASALSIRDATATAANQKLLVAYLRPLPGVDSQGGGLATVRLQGDNDSATVSVSFSNLNSPVNSTQVLNSASSILQSVAPANYGGQLWAIRASQTFATDQAVLDALLAGGVKLAVFTQAHVSGEIEAPFQPVDGSTEFVPPPPAPPVDPLADAGLDRDIVRFLTQATFGPTPADIESLRSLVAAKGGDRIAAYGEWIDHQFALPSPSLLAYTVASNRQGIESRLDPTKSYYDPDYDPVEGNRRRGWWLLARHAPDQLRQRLAFALSEIFVISDVDSVVQSRAYGAAHYYDMLRTGASGGYRELIEGVATHPMMGQFLSHLRNAKATYDTGGNLLVSPDENFAREIMQLFSIGLVHLHPDGSLQLGPDGLPIPTYTQTDITEMARVFTGWSFSLRNNPSDSDTVTENTDFNRGNGNRRFEAQWTNPMKVFPAYHDTGAKSVIGLDLPAGRTGEQDLADILDHLAGHPNTAPFISRLLIQRLVTSNPSPGYLHRTATAFRDSGGNIPATVKSILLDPEARSPEAAAATASFGKPREPLIRYLAFIRAFGGKSQLLLSDLLAYGYPQEELDKFPPGTTRVRMNDTDSSLGQTPLSAPSVFNWFQPDYTPPGLLAANGIASPELQLANDNTVVRVTNYVYSNIYSSSGQGNTSAHPDQTEPPYDGPPYNYTSDSDHVKIDFTPLNTLYMDIVDLNRDGVFNNLDVGAHNNPAVLRQACEAVLDRVDLLLCAGNLKARYGDTPGKPRAIILDAAVSVRSGNNNSNSQQAAVMRDRIEDILWLVMTSPECVIQK